MKRSQQVKTSFDWKQKSISSFFPKPAQKETTKYEIDHVTDFRSAVTSTMRYRGMDDQMGGGT